MEGFLNHPSECAALSRRYRVLVDYNEVNVVWRYQMRQVRHLYMEVPDKWFQVEPAWGMFGVPRSPVVHYYGSAMCRPSFNDSHRDAAFRHGGWLIVGSD